MEIILAIRAALDSGGIFGRLSSTIGIGLANLDRDRAPFFRGPFDFSREDPPTTTVPSRPKRSGSAQVSDFFPDLTGTGGGIFLTPLLLFCRWAHIRQAAAVSALFILVNSIGGLVGYFTKQHSIPSLGLVLSVAAIIGGAIGSRLGSRHFPARTISILLAIVLTIAGAKLILTK